MTEVRWTTCDVEHGCRTFWNRPASELPTSWSTVRRCVVLEDRGDRNLVGWRTRHLCPAHRGQRVEGQIGGNLVEAPSE